MKSSLDMIRAHPGMYIGDVDDGSGVHNMIWEVVANSLDEHLAGHCRRIDVTLHADDSVTVADDGRGIPVADKLAERVLTELHATATSDGHYPHAHVGMIGVGLAAVNALSEWLELDVRRDGQRWRQRFKRGLRLTALRPHGRTRRSGTEIRFRPDPKIFGLRNGRQLGRGVSIHDRSGAGCGDVRRSIRPVRQRAPDEATEHLHPLICRRRSRRALSAIARSRSRRRSGRGGSSSR